MTAENFPRSVDEHFDNNPELLSMQQIEAIIQIIATDVARSHLDAYQVAIWLENAAKRLKSIV
ncbi:MAG: hypothetical protein WAQ25_01490 [Candidatus Saccharimonas sp.]